MNTTPFRDRHVHLMGIGGAGVGALVPLLQAAGARLSGCDVSESASVRRHRAAGITISIGHHPSHGQDVDIFVHTAAVRDDHPEIDAARQAGAQIMTRAQCLVQLMQGTRTIAVAGSHGKSSTTWMLGHLLVQAGNDPVVMVGGGVASLGEGGARVGSGDCFVAETDESDGSFAQVRPEVAIVTNLDHEHLRHYGSFEHLLATFRSWLETIPKHGCVILPISGAASHLGEGLACTVLQVGLDRGDVHGAELALHADGSDVQVEYRGSSRGWMYVPQPGVHMVSNALMAYAAACHVSTTVQTIDLASCERVGRRFTVHGNPRGVRVVEDYGHHPTEIRATIAAARLAGGRVHILFQPHRYSRTVDCFEDFVSAFDQAASVLVAPIYAGSEDPIAGASSQALAQAIADRRRLAGEPGPVTAVSDPEVGLALLQRQARPGDTCLILGAGDIGPYAPMLVQRLEAGGGDVITHPVHMMCRGGGW